jgi:sporulation protein YunB
MQPVIMRFAVSTAETIMLNSANEAVIKILEENNVTYSDIARLSLNDNGYVSSLEIDVYEINNLKSRISNETARIIEEKEYFEVSIPIGTFLGNTYTAGFGPKVKFKMQLTTTAFVDFSHEFRSAGINQVLHIINVDINIGGSLIIAGFNRGINVKTSAIAAQTVIVGATPDAFTNVIESEKDNTGGLINDYGAIIE